MEQYFQLDVLGILKQTKLPANLAWLSEGDKQCLLLVHLGGEAGMHKTQAAKFDKQFPDIIFKLEARDLLTWLTNSHGKQVSLSLTWKGEDIAKLLLLVARNESKKKRTPSPLGI
ncbi:MAG: hypothetical protein Q7S87_16455 [Agitococcus sp.]|nr:hypothetical protein [Agitococcus sp.]